MKSDSTMETVDEWMQWLDHMVIVINHSYEPNSDGWNTWMCYVMNLTCRKIEEIHQMCKERRRMEENMENMSDEERSEMGMSLNSDGGQ